MIDETGKLAQIIVALSLALSFFLLCYFTSPRKIVPVLICLIPFQLIESPYTTSNVMLVYVVGIAYILRGKIRYVPMLGWILLILAVYMISTGFGHRATHVQHGIYIFNWISAVLLFYIVYNFVRETKDLKLILRTLIVLNVLVVAYSVMQITVGKLSVFGIEELTMRGARDGERLSGPFAAVGITAEFLVFHIFLIGYLLIQVKSALKRNLLYVLLAVNLGCLIATANRGGFLSLIGGAGVFLFMYRSQLGLKRTLSLSIAGSFLIVAMSLVLINFTEYGLLYDRLEATELQGGMPENRAANWPSVVRQIGEKPLLGHGPRLRFQDDETRRYPGHEAIQYPHNLYLFLLYTIGFTGLLVYLLFFAGIILRLRAAVNNPSGDIFVDGFTKLGLLLMLLFFVDEIKVEFLRISLIDYWHYIFSILAIWLAFADMRRASEFKGSTEGRAEAVRPMSSIKVDSALQDRMHGTNARPRLRRSVPGRQHGIHGQVNSV